MEKIERREASVDLWGDLEKEEMNSKHAYDMLMQDLNAQIAQATQDRDEKAETKASKLQAKADAEGDLKDTTTTRDADAKYLADLTATCEQKASDFESRQQLRPVETAHIILNAVSVVARIYSARFARKTKELMPYSAVSGVSSLPTGTPSTTSPSITAPCFSSKSPGSPCRT